MNMESRPERALVGILLTLSFSHMLNDTIQALIPSIYPMLKESFGLSFTQIGLITLVNQMTASLLQPVVGHYTDGKPMPYSLPVGMAFTLAGLVLLGFANHFAIILIAVAMVGIGSSVFHPEASRVARLASGGWHGFAQSVFQVGGNFGTSLGPLLAALVIVPNGQRHILWFSLLALIGILVLSRVSGWYQRHLVSGTHQAGTVPKGRLHPHLSTARVVFSLAILILLIFSKYIYLSSLSSYYTFYLIERFGVSVQASQIYLFVFLFAVAAGTILGGPVGDKIGRKYVIWASILGVAPFSLAMPYLGLAGTVILSVFIGVILASAFSAILVYAQELIPGRVGLVAGLFFGFAFGIAGIGSAVIGKLADQEGIIQVFHWCAYLPLIGLLTGFLPDIEHAVLKNKKAAV